MRSFTTIAAVAAIASTAAAYEYEEDIFAREADAEPILGLNHVSKWIGNAAGSVVGGYKQKANPGGYGGSNSYTSTSSTSYSRRDLEDLEDMLAARDAEPILGLNHVSKWIGNAAGSVVGGYKQKANPGGYGGSYESYSKRDLEDLEELLAARDAEAEPILGLNHVSKWIGNAAGSVVGGYKQKANPGGYGGGYESYSKRDLEELEEILAARDAEAEAEPILGLNHVSKWIGNAAGSVVGGYKQKANPGGYGGGYESYSKRDLEELEEILAARDAEAEAEPILGLNHVSKWIGNAAGSVVGGYKQKANPGYSSSYSDPSAQVYARDAEFDDEEFWFDY